MPSRHWFDLGCFLTDLNRTDGAWILLEMVLAGNIVSSVTRLRISDDNASRMEARLG